MTIDDGNVKKKYPWHRRLEAELKKVWPGHYGDDRVSVAACPAGTGNEAVQRAVEALSVDWDGKIAKDCYGAPYLPQWEQKKGARVSISLAEDGDMRVCLAALHVEEIGGIGVDLGFSREFDAAYAKGVYGAGSLFTASERAALEGKPIEAQKERLIRLFTAKEAAFKSMSRRIRECIPEWEADEHRAEFRDFEIVEKRNGLILAEPRRGTAQTAGLLGIRHFFVATITDQDLSVSAAVCL